MQQTHTEDTQYPDYQVMGNAKLHDGRDVVIMTAEQWHSYCFNFNAMNNLQQPRQLLQDLQFYREDKDRQEAEAQAAIDEKRSKRTWSGRTYRSLKTYLKLLIPFLCLVWLYEDATNP